jgi:hypothetical protein
VQETKLTDDAFTELLGEQLAHRGYAVAHQGEARWNGVAILSRVGLVDVVTGVAGAPGFPHPEARAVAATCGGIRVHSVYVPNGRVPDSDHYHYKLAWLAALREVVGAGPEAAIVCGDMNIAPTDADVFDPDAYIEQTHVTPQERAALAELQARHADRPSSRHRPGRGQGTGSLGRPARPQGHRPERPCPGDRRPGRSTGRRHRAGRTAALRAGHPTRRQNCPKPGDPLTSGAGKASLAGSNPATFGWHLDGQVRSCPGALGSEPQRERRVDLKAAQQERAFVEPLPPQPTGDFVVAFAGVAGAAGRHDVVKRVAPTTGDRQQAVPLQRLVRLAAVCAATPRILDRGPPPRR